MKRRIGLRTVRRMLLLLVSVGLLPRVATAQMPPMDISGLVQQNVDFSNQQQAAMQAMQQQLQAQEQQALQAYIRDNYPRLAAGYQQFVAACGPIESFEQYAYNDALTKGGTDTAGALENNRRNFEGLRRAHDTQMEGYDIKNRGWEQNQQQTARALERYDQEAVRGNQEYVNPQTGLSVELPIAGEEGAYRGPDGQVYYLDAEGRHYLVDSQGGLHLLQPAPRDTPPGNPRGGEDSEDEDGGG